MVQARATGPGFRPYAWAQTAAVAARNGLSRAHVLRFDANLPALPAPLPVAARRALAERGEYPEGSYAELRAAAASYAGRAPDEVGVDRDDDLLLDALEAVAAPGACRSVTVLQPGVRVSLTLDGSGRSSVGTGDDALDDELEAQGWNLELAADDGVGAEAVVAALAGAEARASAPAVRS